ncbi:Bacterial type II secretion system protein F domain protein [Gimesia chilikensis]|uniref:Bacterial type II secretion system protein F domain protein n=1 Tax=Gimesia chilikensis TaxID=2605989 RepID=A0A517WGP3_9PLAN|nr:type II secretion system F family protein [Gimesia chilikensis]QDU04425.1 Bacterial type II secretion system protein F domain protein [Gimesia chilikensis]
MPTFWQLVPILVVWLLIGAGGYYLLRYWFIRQSVQERLRSPLQEEYAEEESLSILHGNLLTRWLITAGFRSPNAPVWFVVLSLAGLLFGIGFVATIYWLGAVDQATLLLRVLPGGVGEVFLPLAWSSPWIGGLLLGLLPALYVRSKRIRRVREIEKDLPLTLDLLATLAEAGLSFDSAMDRIVSTQKELRALAQELRLFQLDILAGRPRVDALRLLMRRIDVPWFSNFVSAVIHAEQAGSSLAVTLRTQANDLRMRRRERALAMAMAIQVKLLFPLIACFLPGILTAALGPVIYQIVKVLDAFLKGSLGG